MQYGSRTLFSTSPAASGMADRKKSATARGDCRNRQVATLDAYMQVSLSALCRQVFGFTVNPAPVFADSERSLSSTIGPIMKYAIAFLLLALVSSPALAGKNCDELKAELTAKLDAHGVKNYTLDVVDNADIKDRKVIGSCAAGSKKIVYSKNKPST